MSKTLSLAKIGAKIIYFFLKLIPVQNKVVFISRLSSKTTIDFKVLIEEIETINSQPKIVVLNHKLRNKSLLVIDVLKEMYHLATSKCAIIDSYVIPVSVLKHKRGLIIIQIWHSIGVTKRFGYMGLDTKEGAKSDIAHTMNMHQNYSYIIAGGNKSIPIYEKCFNYPKKQIIGYGLPRMDYLLNKENKITIKNKLYTKYSLLLQDRKNIVYIPTFRKGKIIPYDKIINQIDFTKYNLIIRQHPLDKTKINDERVLFLKEEDTLDILFITDYLISDYSAVCFEAALLDIPMFFYIYDFEEYEVRRGLYLDMKNNAPGFSSPNAKEIIQAINNNNYDLKTIREFKYEHIDYLDGNSAKRIIGLLNLGVEYETENEIIPIKDC